jgi:hypothetical protein
VGGKVVARTTGSSRHLVVLAIALLASVSLAIPILAISPPSARASTEQTILIIAPHPDDDVLYGAGIAYDARARGTAVKVVYLTNGDLFGVAAGLARQDEAVHGQMAIGGSGPVAEFGPCGRPRPELATGWRAA